MAETGDHQQQLQQELNEAARKNVNIELAAREPWPMNTNFFLPLKEQMVIWAPTCLATLCLLRKVRVPSLIVQHVRNAAEMSTNGVPPVITLNNRIFCEFEDVANLIELKGLLPVDTVSDSTTESYSLLCTETLGTLMKYFLLCEKAGTTVYQSFVSVYPWPLGLILFLIYRNQTVKALKVQDIWSLTYEQASIKFDTTVKALSEKIEQNQSEFLFGENFTKADAHLYGHLYPILHGRISEYDNLRTILQKYAPLVDYVNNIEKDVHGLSVLV